MARNITIQDVARAAGVSITTVSRALNNKPDVAPATRQRILEVIEELGYAPHAQAQNLVAGKSHSIAVLFPADTAGFSQLEFEFFLGAANVFSKANYLFNLIFEPVSEHQLLNLYRTTQIDGAILMEIHLQDWRVDLLREHGYPFVMIGHCADNTGVSYVDLDFDAAAALACEHLLKLGHRSIALINLIGQVRSEGYGPSTRVLQGYLRFCQKHRLQPIAADATGRTEDVYRVTSELLDAHPDITAFIAHHGSEVVGITRALLQRNLKLPQDVSLVGIISDKTAELLTPPMTAVSFPAFQMGLRAAQMLIAKLQDPNYRDQQILLKPRLVVRESSGPAPQRA